MERRRNPAVNGVCNEACLEFGEEPRPSTNSDHFFQSIGSKPITYDNDFPPRNQALLTEVKHVEDIIITRDTENLGVSRRDVIQMISDIGQASSYFQAENHLD